VSWNRRSRAFGAKAKLRSSRASLGLVRIHPARYFLDSADAPVVKRTSRRSPEPQVRVRFPAGANSIWKYRHFLRFRLWQWRTSGLPEPMKSARRSRQVETLLRRSADPSTVNLHHPAPILQCGCRCVLPMVGLKNQSATSATSISRKTTRAFPNV
jgi:hypothetical protein